MARRAGKGQGFSSGVIGEPVEVVEYAAAGAASTSHRDRT